MKKTDYITPLLSRQTFEKARDIVIQSLFDKEPKESIVLIRNDKILFYGKGDEFEAEIPDEIMDDIFRVTAIL